MAEAMDEDRASTLNLHEDDYFMAQAVLASKISKDPRTQVGACIVNKDLETVGIGWNGMPNGCDNLPWARETGTLEDKHLYVCHAELNAILNKKSADVKGCTMYVTLFPCNECAKLIIQEGLKEVVYLCDKYKARIPFQASRKLLEEAKIPFKEFKPKSSNTEFTLSLEYNEEMEE
ncbi:unnamed protein product [Arctogadus glacialis]